MTDTTERAGVDNAGLTHAEFAMMAARIAAVAASWAADTLSLPDYRGKPVSKDALRRFCEAIRFHVDCIEKEALSPTPGGDDATDPA